jgi:hypothetical protein
VHLAWFVGFRRVGSLKTPVVNTIRRTPGTADAHRTTPAYRYSLEREAACEAIQVLEDTLVLATVATDEDDDDEAPDNTRNQ